MVNLVVNPDFSQSEVGAETAVGWQTRSDGNKFSYRIDEINDPNTSQLKRIQRVIGDGRGDGYVWQRFAVEEDTHYTVSGKVKTEGETTAQLWLFFQDGNGKVLERAKTEYILGNTDWTTLEVDCRSPMGAREGVLFVISFTVSESASSLWERVDVFQHNRQPQEAQNSLQDQKVPPEESDTHQRAGGITNDSHQAAGLVVIPKPQSLLVMKEQAFRLTSGSHIVLHASVGDHSTNQVARYLQASIENRCGLRISSETAETKSSGPHRDGVIHLGVIGDDPWADDKLRQLSSTATGHPEGYCLEVNGNAVHIIAADARGLFYGVQSLLQLIGQKTESPDQIPGCRIDDWPDVPWRGVHILMDFRSVDFVKNLIDQVFARYKYNTIVLECSMAKWETHPELWQPEAVEKQQLKEVICYAQERLIEVIPLIQSLGHCQYLFLNQTHREICEDPEHPWAYNPLDERSYKLIFDIMNEAIDLFQPKFLHIGHDEVRMTGKFPNSEEGRRIGFANLFVKDTNRIAGFLRDHGVRTMMWADVVLETEFADHAKRLERDIVMVDWQYNPFRNYQGIDVLRRAGFDAIGSTWYVPLNIHTFAKYMKRVGGTGMLQTTWTGHFGSAQAAGKEIHQYVAHVYAAEAFWNADGYTAVDQVPYDAEALIRKVVEQFTVTTVIPDWGREW